jgi:hypothetical protein
MQGVCSQAAGVQLVEWVDWPSAFSCILRSDNLGIGWWDFVQKSRFNETAQQQVQRVCNLLGRTPDMSKQSLVVSACRVEIR